MIKTLEFDYLVIAMKTGVFVDSIKDNLVKNGVDSSKIIYIGARKLVSGLVEGVEKAEISLSEKMAYEHDGIAIAMWLSAALGDCIVRKKVFDELLRIEPSCIFDIYAPYATETIRAIYGKHPNLNLIIDDAGVLYKKTMRRYQLALTSINPRLAVDYWDEAGLAKKVQSC